MRNEFGKRGQAIQSASRKKAGPEQLCKLFSAFTAAEGRMLQALEERRVACGVPAGVIEQLKAGHGQAAQATKQVCEVAKGEPAGFTPSAADPAAACDGLWARLSCGWGADR